MTRIVSLDIALAKSGWAVLDDGMLSQYGVISTLPECSAAERIRVLWDGLTRVICRYPLDSHIAIEEADWSHGAGSTRLDWIREAKATRALGTALGVAVSFCLAHDLKYTVMGVKAWQAEFGAGRKLAVAELVAAEFPRHFHGSVETRVRMDGRKEFVKVVVDAKGRRVQDHITDAIALGIVVSKQLQLKERIQKAEAA